jgi:PAS domain S-box-containing protein
MVGPDSPYSAAAPSPRLTATLEAIGAGAYVVDERGRIAAANSRAVQLLGRPVGELLGQDAHDLLHRGPQGQQLPTSQCGMRQAFHAGSPAQGGDEYFERADGSLLPISWMITPYDIGEGRVGTLVVAASAPGVSGMCDQPVPSRRSGRATALSSRPPTRGNSATRSSPATACRVDLLCSDELGYMELDRHVAEPLIQVQCDRSAARPVSSRRTRAGASPARASRSTPRS